ncbi:pyridoxal-phosphate dependent enzyme [Oceanobacillus bengalensis]|uniref:threonine ammonia-lyase n=1 Tax=Oceanobacillus bengalensis TaxID=1435466 RepID=A0A494YXN5_9BACI|nr:pyridoxal-phosphate dependent enzyme [Oceanobacillus bengalensis]RKQ14935.1 pyridoxal-phosphate dependent enzyme [Oceanobacillus bengalensis]
MVGINLQDVWRARKRISSFINHTPLIFSPELSSISRTNVYLKLENLNTSYSFKIRGAANKILSLSNEEKKRGITTFSTGNFGMSVTCVAMKLGIRAVICISNRVPKAKVDLLKRAGAEIKVVGNSQDDAESASYKLETEQGLTVIHPFDDALVIAGQGTIGLEILQDLPEVDTVLAGLSGGGLHSGLGVALKNTASTIHLIGLSTSKGATMLESIRAGKPIAIQEQDTLADSLLGGIGLQNKFTFELVRNYVDEIFLLEEDEFEKGMAFMFKHHRMIIEGAAASGIAAILSGKGHLGSNVVVVISGCSVDPAVVMEIVRREERA